MPPVIRFTLPIAIDSFDLEQFRSMFQMFCRFMLPDIQLLAFKIEFATPYFQPTVEILGMIVF